MLPAQDHKRLKDGDKGPNTGGMGAYCPCPLLTPKLQEEVYTEILQKTIKGLRKEGINFVGKSFICENKGPLRKTSSAFINPTQ